MRPTGMDMTMEDDGGVSSSVQQQQQQPAFGYGHGQPPPFWSTPTPYLFIGFAVVMALIAVALAVLICSRRKEEEGPRSRGAGEEVMSVRVLTPLGREDAAMPKVVVVMAGDHAPSFLASAVPLTSFAGAAKAQMPQYVGGGKDGAATATAM
ncbi:protein GLUTAMINE DUMPER 6-like [Phragmites australis]|uniref:protein GLUTAMINE DUMPER 6-like n=1 Tax=Phragmites australis TaxID=29695 RepID=UPI002D783248|nr:protein GLUTAMINE DUMPER 6-like [Phragmites australis]